MTFLPNSMDVPAVHLMPSDVGTSVNISFEMLRSGIECGATDELSATYCAMTAPHEGSASELRMLRLLPEALSDGMFMVNIPVAWSLSGRVRAVPSRVMSTLPAGITHAGDEVIRFAMTRAA